MEKLTKEEYEFLTTYKDRLETATISNYIRAIPSNQVHQMRVIYSRIIGSEYQMTETCGACVLTLCKKLKPIYDEYEKDIEGNTTGCPSETESDSSEISGGEKQVRNTKRAKKQA